AVCGPECVQGTVVAEQRSDCRGHCDRIDGFAIEQYVPDESRVVGDRILWTCDRRGETRGECRRGIVESGGAEVSHQLLTGLRIELRMDRQYLLALDEHFDRGCARQGDGRQSVLHERGDSNA